MAMVQTAWSRLTARKVETAFDEIIESLVNTSSNLAAIEQRRRRPGERPQAPRSGKAGGLSAPPCTLALGEGPLRPGHGAGGAGR